MNTPTMNTPTKKRPQDSQEYTTSEDGYETDAT